jgi:transcriptional accessory protein Tex/SPT6
LADVLALEGEDASATVKGVRGALADYEQLFRAQEVNKRMKEKAAHACHALCRARVVEGIRLRNGTPAAERLKLVLSIIENMRHVCFWHKADMLVAPRNVCFRG